MRCVVVVCGGNDGSGDNDGGNGRGDDGGGGDVGGSGGAASRDFRARGAPPSRRRATTP